MTKVCFRIAKTKKKKRKKGKKDGERVKTKIEIHGVTKNEKKNTKRGRNLSSILPLKDN